MAKILYVLHTFELAGSQNSLLAHAKSMRSVGHDIHFVGEAGPFEQKLKREDIAYDTRPYYPFSPFSIVGLIKLAVIVHRIGPDILHSNAYWPHIECLFLKAIYKLPVISTFAGGPLFGKPMIPGCPLISYSAELKKAIIGRFGKRFEDMLVIRNRIELVPLPHYHEPIVERTTPPRSLLFVSRLDSDKESSITVFLNMMDNLRYQYPNVLGKILGTGNISASVESWVVDINNKHDAEFISMEGHRTEVYPEIEENDIVIGLGRSAMEGMFCGKPVLIPCTNGSLSLFVEWNSEIHAHFNLSGRAHFTEKDREKDKKNLIKIMNDIDYYNETAAFSKKYVIDNYEVTKVQNQMSNIYESEIIRIHRMSTPISRMILINKCIVAYTKGMLQRSKNVGEHLKMKIREAKVRRKR